MNAWWPRLYTLPQIKLVGKINALVTVLVVMGCSLLPEYSHKFFFLYLVPLFVFLSGGVDGMLRNLDFHRMSIPVEELRNAFFLDLAFQSIVYFFTTFFFILLPFKVFFAGADLRLHPLVMLLTGTFSYTIFASVFCFFFVLNSRITLKYDQNDYLYLSVLGCIFFVIKMAGMNPVFYIMMIALSVMSARVFYLVQIRFYQKKNFKVSGLIGLCAVFFSISCAWLFRYDINNPGFGPGQKYKGMFVFSDFMPKLSPHTVKSLTEETHAVDLVFRHATPAVYQMPAEVFLESGEQNLINAYLKYGKPGEENLLYIQMLLEGARDIDYHRPDEFSFR